MLAAHASNAASTGNENDKQGEHRQHTKRTGGANNNTGDDDDDNDNSNNGGSPMIAARSGLSKCVDNGKTVTDHRHGLSSRGDDIIASCVGSPGGGVVRRRDSGRGVRGRGAGAGAGGVDGVEPVGGNEKTIPAEEKKAAVIRAQMSVLMVGLYEIIRQVRVFFLSRKALNCPWHCLPVCGGASLSYRTTTIARYRSIPLRARCKGGGEGIFAALDKHAQTVLLRS